MRRGPVVGNIFSIASSYAFVAGFARYLNRRLPRNIENGPWWMNIPPPSPSEHDSPLPDLSQDIITVESELLNHTSAKYVLDWVEKGNKWVDKMDIFILYLIGLICLLMLPLHDVWVERSRRSPRSRDRHDETSLTQQEDTQEEKGNKEVHKEENTPKNEEVQREEIQPNILNQEREEITPIEDITLDASEGSELEEKERDTEENEHPIQIEVEDEDEEDKTDQDRGEEETKPSSSATSSPVAIPKPLKQESESLNLPFKPDLPNQSSQSSSSSFIQFSPSKSSQLNAQLDTKNAYSQPFKFK